MEKQRYLTANIIADLMDKMVFVGGARQVGKTTLAKNLIGDKFNDSTYYNWDYRPDRKKITNLELPGVESLLIFDEIHKNPKWKNLIKGIYDTNKNKYKIVVTGSARLNIYRKGGDSLQGRYHYYTLHPFSVAELNGIKNKFDPFEELDFHSRNYDEDLKNLLKFGGFPEPFMKQTERFFRRWQNEKLDRLFREDVRDLQNIKDMNSMIILSDLLESKAASPLSINSMREDLNVSHKAITNWLNILESFYYHFRIYPYTSRKIRSIKKEPKLYLLDWSEVENKGARFENLIASHLLKFRDYLKEYEGYKTELKYLRNVDKKEMDFLITVNNKPWFAIETKLSETEPSPVIQYFKAKLKIPFLFQVTGTSKIDKIRDGVRIISADKFLSALV